MISIPLGYDSPLRMAFGTMADLKPSFCASRNRGTICPGMRNSPAKPISPISTASARTGTSFHEEAIAAATAKSAAGSSIWMPPTTLTKISCSASLSPTRRVSTAVINSRRLKSTPLGVRRALPNCVGEVSPWISTKIGRVPSIVTAMAEPAALIMRSARNASLGLVTSIMPPSRISNTPTSEVAPKRFFTERSKRYAWKRSPSRYSTVSTICSSTRGPAMAPSFVTWPTMNTVRPLDFASSRNCEAHSRTCETDPALESSSERYVVWIESTTSRSGLTSRM